MNNYAKRNRIILKILILLFACFMIFLIYTKVKEDNKPEKIIETKMQDLFSSVDKTNTVNISKYSVYGTHFNIEGTLNIIKISDINIDFVDLVIKDLDGTENTITANFNYADNTLSFSTFDSINDGINLEALTPNTFYIFVKVTYSNGDIKYYPLNNATQYGDITYYTITKNGCNNKINILFDKYNEISYMLINVNKAENLPEDVYDIAIDPGHGGLDKGATSGDYTESDIVLKYSLKLKSELEALGLKVFISRDGTENSKEDTTTNMYDDNGRITILNESKAKLILSIHVNNNNYGKENGGVEVYAPNNCNLDFASSIAKNIVEIANTNYSKYTGYKKADGVYVQNFTNADIVAFDNRAKKGGYEKYNLTTSTPYLYIIRETGGITTNAFVDGRNPSFGTNKYCHSNVGIETYQIELGYMKNPQDLDNILNNSENYIKAILQSVQEFYNI